MELSLTQIIFAIFIKIFILLLLDKKLLMLVINKINIKSFTLFQKKNLLLSLIFWLSKLSEVTVIRFIVEDSFILVGGQKYEFF